MRFQKRRAMPACISAISVTTRQRSDIIKKLKMPSGKRRVLSSAVVIIMTADGMHPAFSGRHPKLFYNFRSLPTSHGNCRSPFVNAEEHRIC